MTDNPDAKPLLDDLLKLLDKSPIGILFFSEEWLIRYVNENFFNFDFPQHGSRTLSTGENILECNLVEYLDIKDDLLGLADGIFFEKEIKKVKTISGSSISIIVKGTSVFEGDIFNGGILIIEDIKIIHDAEKDNFIQTDIIKTIYSEFSDLFFITDKHLKIKYSYASEAGRNILADINPADGKLGELLKMLNFSYSSELIETFLSLKRAITEKIFLNNSEQSAFQIKLIPCFDSKKRLTLVSVSLKDITKEEQGTLLHQAEISELNKYQVITSAVTDALIGLDLNGNINFWNKSAEQLFSYRKNETFGKFIGRIIETFDERYFDKIKTEIAQGSIWESELKITNSMGNEIFISARINLIGDNDNKSFVLLCRDVSERITIEKELRISEERFRNIVVNANEYICNLDLLGRVIFVNPAFLKAFEYSEGEIMGMNIGELIHPEQLAGRTFNLQFYLNSSHSSAELYCISKSGRAFYILANFSAIMNFNNTTRYYNGIFTDISEKKKIEKDFLMIRSVYEASRDGIAVETDKKFIFVNDSFAEIFGFDDPNELIGIDPITLIAEEDIPKIVKYNQIREEKISSLNNYEILCRKKDASVFFAEFSVTSYESENLLHLVSICRDITERKRAQQAIKESEEKYRSITENIDDFLWTAERINNNIRPVFYTSTIEKITGYKQEQFIRDSKLWFKLVYPDDLELVKKKTRSLFNDSARFSDDYEFRIINREGNIVWVKNKLTLKRDSKGLPVKVFGLVSNISLNKKAEEELRKSAESLQQVNDTKDRFISIISHDLRTPFSSILGFTDILLNEKNISDSQKNQYINFIQESSRNMLSLVNSLLDWTRIQTGRIKFEPERMKAADIVSKAVTINSGNAIKKDIPILSLVKDTIFVHCDQQLILQVFNNLISNAIKFTPPGGTISISAYPSLKNNQIQFVVKDTGIGISGEDIDKLFKIDSKFTTDGTAGERGSGLGLSLVQEIVSKHGGKIWVESEPGKGTEVNFTIPVSSASILIIDDNKTDRLLYTKILKYIIPSYEVYTANNGREAFELLKQFTPALIITDHNMPEMSGYDFVKELKISSLKGKPPVIVLSGDINKSISEEYRELGIEFIFQKPVNLSNFKDAVNKSLRKALFN